MAEKRNAGSLGNVTGNVTITGNTLSKDSKDSKDSKEAKPSKRPCKPTVERVNDPEFIGSYGGAVRASCKGCGCETAVRANARRALAELETLCTRDKA